MFSFVLYPPVFLKLKVSANILEERGKKGIAVVTFIDSDNESIKGLWAYNLIIVHLSKRRIFKAMIQELAGINIEQYIKLEVVYRLKARTTVYYVSIICKVYIDVNLLHSLVDFGIIVCVDKLGLTCHRGLNVIVSMEVLLFNRIYFYLSFQSFFVEHSKDE